MPESRPWRAATLWLVGLGFFFLLTYGFANSVSSQRSRVPSIVFEWEHRIPFLAWTIVPYWSTDLFYAWSFFLCRSRPELETHVKRLLAAQIISVLVFLLFPLRFSFEQPQTTGLFGFMFHMLSSFDKPFNQAPSLHLSLTTILWAKYSERLRGLSLFLLRSWFVITGLATLTTYQHHFIDLPTGVGLGLFCIMLFPARHVPPPVATARPGRNMLIGSIYLAAFVCLITVGWWLGGFAWLLLWPASALLMVAAAYWTGSPQLFRGQNGQNGQNDQNGTMNPMSTMLLAPYLAAARLNSRWWTRNQSAADEIVPGVWLGRVPTKAECKRLRIASVVNLAPELPMDTTGMVCHRVPMLDLIVPEAGDLEAAARAIDVLKARRPTLVCCALGYSRGAMAIAAWLVASETSPSVNSAIALIRTHRQCIVLSAAHRIRLEEWELARSKHGD